MKIKDIISKKKYGQKLTKEEIEYFVAAYTSDLIPDYQVAALLMCVYFQSMDAEETAHLTNAMAKSGELLDLSSIQGLKVDKHSTGGVGDKISLIVLPIMAALGIPIAKMSGRGLGHTGGTIDKLESIPGFQVAIPTDMFIRLVRENGMALVGQTGNLTPADKKIYALRDAIECVDSIPLIASSIMSKKIAAGADAIVLDIKVGSGAFMKTEEDARKLAKAMVEIGTSLGRKTVAVLTRMEEPLGKAVGNANEVVEAIRFLNGHGATDEKEVAYEIATQMALLGGHFADYQEARNAVVQSVESGNALSKMKTFLSAQGGSGSVVDMPESLLSHADRKMVHTKEHGYLSAIDAGLVGRAAMKLGAGREKKGEEIDPLAGVNCIRKLGDYVNAGDPIFELLASNNSQKADFVEAEELLLRAIRFSERKHQSPQYVIGVIK